ncbi:MAG: YraN family protein [Chitinispirillaceae bacterium]|nr:YraN family protein [Chitinispirillaceae bacterium]
MGLSGPGSFTQGTPGDGASTRAKGASAEETAAEYLVNKKYKILERNYRVRKGEIDCIAVDSDGTLVFVEVKSARTGRCGHPFFWVDAAKQRTITKVARWYLAEHGITSRACRFDVIALSNGKVEHLRNAFLAE